MKMFSEAKMLSVDIRAKRQETKRMLRGVYTFAGRGRTEMGFDRVLA